MLLCHYLILCLRVFVCLGVLVFRCVLVGNCVLHCLPGLRAGARKDPSAPTKLCFQGSQNVVYLLLFVEGGGGGAVSSQLAMCACCQLAMCACCQCFSNIICKRARVPRALTQACTCACV